MPMLQPEGVLCCGGGGGHIAQVEGISFRDYSTYPLIFLPGKIPLPLAKLGLRGVEMVPTELPTADGPT